MRFKEAPIARGADRETKDDLDEEGQDEDSNNRPQNKRIAEFFSALLNKEAVYKESVHMPREKACMSLLGIFGRFQEDLRKYESCQNASPRVSYSTSF